MTYRELGAARGISAASAARLAFRKGWQRQPGNDGAARVAVPVGEDQPSPYDARGGAGDAVGEKAPRDGARGAVGHGARGAAIEALRNELTASHQREAEANSRADAANSRALAAESDRRQAEARADAERARADALRDRLDEMQSRIGMIDAFETERSELQTEIDVLRRAVAAREAEHASASARLAEAQAEAERHAAAQSELHAVEAELRQAHHVVQEAQDAADALRQAEAARKARGLGARLRAAWRGE